MSRRQESSTNNTFFERGVHGTALGCPLPTLIPGLGATAFCGVRNRATPFVKLEGVLCNFSSYWLTAEDFSFSFP